MAAAQKHRWNFIRIGGVDQVVIRSGADIINLDQLDQKLWVALACPTKMVEFDTRTLELIDTDKDGRIRAPEIVAVSRWIREVYKNPDELLKGGEAVPISAINETSPAGAELRAGADRLAAGQPAIALTDVLAALKAYTSRPLNGDGVITAESAPDEAARQAISEILATVGGVPDRSGKTGVDQAKVDAFFNDAAALLAWHDKADETILPIGPDTLRAVEATQRVSARIDDFFTRCRLAEFAADASELLNPVETEFRALSGKELSTSTPEIARLPLASAGAARALPLEGRINPAWRAAMADFQSLAVVKILGARAELRPEDWRQLQQTLSPCQNWLAAKPQSPVQKLPPIRLREILNTGLREQLSQLIKSDLAEEARHQELLALEKLTRMQRDLLRLLNNFVSFSDFYQRRGAIFQAGTLYLDARACELCVPVADAGKHAALAGLARSYLAYCDCTRLGEKISVAAAFTAGDSDQLMVGRNGVFYDRKGRDWDATITKIVDNPISLGQAFWSPYKKLVRLIEEQVAKRAAAADTAAQARLGTTATHVASIDLPKTTAPADKKVDVGTVAALGVAMGSIGTFLGLIFAKFIDLGWWIPIALLGIVAAISGPAVLIAWLKLRQRNLGPILDANGWAVNGRMKINVPFGGALSKRAKIPPDAGRQLVDPFTETHPARTRLITLGALALLAAVLWWFGLLDTVLPDHWQRQPALAPVAAPVPAPAP